MTVDKKIVAIILVAISTSIGSASLAPEPVCSATPKLEVVSVIAEAAGAYPVWLVDGSSGRWTSKDTPVKTAWILARDNPGDLTVVARNLDSDDRAQFGFGGNTELVDKLVIAAADRPQMLPGGADADTLRTYSFRSSAVVYPSAGCWEFLVTYGESQSTIVVELAEG